MRSGNLGASAQHVLLIVINAAVAVTIAVLIALAIMEHFEDTPEIRSLACATGIRQTDCAGPHAEPQPLQSEVEEVEDRMAGLRAIEHAVDRITLFENETDPVSGYEITIGTVYRDLTGLNPRPEYHFCYVNLPRGRAGENRTLRFQTDTGPVPISSETLRRSRLDAAVLRFGRSVCRPLEIAPQIRERST